MGKALGFSSEPPKIISMWEVLGGSLANKGFAQSLHRPGKALTFASHSQGLVPGGARTNTTIHLGGA